METYQSQIGNRKSAILMWSLLALGTLLFLCLIIGAPVAAAENHGSTAGVIYAAFSKICHQRPERSFFIMGYPLAVCSRCTGLYVGFSLALITYPLVRSLQTVTAPDRKWLFLAAVPMALDFTLTFTGIWENTHSSRFLTGLLLGSVAVFYVMPGISELALRFFKSRASSSERTTLSPLVTSTPMSSAPSDYSAPHRRI
jgi:uncharacterized membrane protein